MKGAGSVGKDPNASSAQYCLDAFMELVKDL